MVLDKFAEKLKHLPSKHVQLTHGRGGKGVGGGGSPDESAEKLTSLHKSLSEDLNYKFSVGMPARDRLTKKFDNADIVSVKDGLNDQLDRTRTSMKELGRTQKQIDDYIDQQIGLNSFAGEYYGQWGNSSTNNGGFQDALQSEAFERQGGKKYRGMTKGKNKPGMSKEHRKLAYDAIKDDTQKWFKENGFKPDDDITIYRGMVFSIDNNTKLDFDVGNVVKKDSFKHHPLSAWSYDKNVGKEFASDKGRLDTGVTFAATVKVKDIFSTAGSGLGVFTLSEVVMESSKIGDIAMVDIQ